MNNPIVELHTVQNSKNKDQYFTYFWEVETGTMFFQIIHRPKWLRILIRVSLVVLALLLIFLATTSAKLTMSFWIRVSLVILLVLVSLLSPLYKTKRSQKDIDKNIGGRFVLRLGRAKTTFQRKLVLMRRWNWIMAISAGATLLFAMRYILYMTVFDFAAFLTFVAVFSLYWRKFPNNKKDYRTLKKALIAIEIQEAEEIQQKQTELYPKADD